MWPRARGRGSQVAHMPGDPPPPDFGRLLNVLSSVAYEGGRRAGHDGIQPDAWATGCVGQGCGVRRAGGDRDGLSAAQAVCRRSCRRVSVSIHWRRGSRAAGLSGLPAPYVCWLHGDLCSRNGDGAAHAGEACSLQTHHSLFDLSGCALETSVQRCAPTIFGEDRETVLPALIRHPRQPRPRERPQDWQTS